MKRRCLRKQRSPYPLMLIRPARPDDVPHVLPMVAQICALHETWDADKYGFLPDPAERYRRWLTRLTQQPQAIFLVAEASPEISPERSSGTSSPAATQLAGFLVATIEDEIPIYRLNQYGFIHDLWVEPDYRHQGIAQQLVERAIAQFTQLGIQQIRLDTVVVNEAAQALFQRCGFRPSVIEMLYVTQPD